MSPKPIHVLSETNDKVATAVGGLTGLFALIALVCAVLLFVKEQTVGAWVLVVVAVVFGLLAAIWLRQRRIVLSGDTAFLSRVGRWTIPHENIAGLTVGEVKTLVGKQLSCLVEVAKDRCPEDLARSAKASRSLRRELPARDGEVIVVPINPGSVDAIGKWALDEKLTFGLF